MLTARELREIELKYCRENPVYFVETYVHIEDKSAAELIQPFKLWDAQKQALQELVDNRMNVILKARQLGITWLALAESARLMMCWTGRTVVAISRAEEEAKELVRRTAVILRNMPEFIREEGNVPQGWSGATFKASSLEITINHPEAPESKFKAFLSSPSAARGFTADLIILDEWAFQQFAEEIWASIFPVMNRPTSGRVIGLSTIKRGTLFEEIFTNPDNGFHKIFLPWSADPTRDKAWYTRTLGALGEDMTLQEYPATIDEALLVPGGQFFPEVKKETHVRDDDFFTDKVRRYIAIDYGLDMFSAHWIAINKHGRARVYREYDAPNTIIPAAAQIALDLSQGEEIEAVLAPPDLWSRDQQTGKSRASLFEDAGLTLTKVSNDFPAGCAAMKNWLQVVDGEAYLTFQRNKCPNLYKNLQKILKDEKRPDVYAKEPHSLTHDPDSLRYFCVWWTSPAEIFNEYKRAKWEQDQYEDYDNATPAEQETLLKKWGNPF